MRRLVPYSVAILAASSLVHCTLDSSSGCFQTRTCSGPDGGTDSARGGQSGSASGTGGGDGGNTGGGTTATGGVGGSGGDAGMTGGASSGGTAGAGTGGGNGGGGGIAGAGGAVPCGGACKGKTPVCSTATDKCVECTKSSQCSSTKPACDTSANKCVECIGSSDCTGNANGAVCDTSKSACVQCLGSGDCAGNAATPVCEVATSMCVQCVTSGDCATKTATPVCDTAMNTCVQCLASTDCKDAAAARCDGDACKPCMADDDCAHVSGKGVCSSGACVQCTPADESGCNGKSCNPTTKQCTSTTVGSIDLCTPCLADSECKGGNQPDPDVRCVPMTFQGAQRPGGFCLRRGAKTCLRPYKIPITAMSLSGASPEPYCGIDQDSTRCEAVLDLNNSVTCPDGKDTSCGCSRDKDGKCIAPGQGGLCRMVGFDANRCTYPCGAVEQCNSGYLCPNPPSFCQ